MRCGKYGMLRGVTDTAGYIERVGGGLKNVTGTLVVPFSHVCCVRASSSDYFVSLCREKVKP